MVNKFVVSGLIKEFNGETNEVTVAIEDVRRKNKTFDVKFFANEKDAKEIINGINAGALIIANLEGGLTMVEQGRIEIEVNSINFSFFAPGMGTKMDRNQMN